MNRRFAAKRLAMLASVAVFVLSLALYAQYQVNRQLYGSPGPTAASMRFQPQYLGGPASAPPTANLLPSEVRNAYVRSGQLPSNIRMSYNAIGPLSPTGAIGYIYPTNSQIKGPPAGPSNAINPMVSANVGGSGAPRSPYTTGVSGSIHYAGAPAAPVSAVPTFTPLQGTSYTGGVAQSVNPSAITGSVGYVSGTATPSGNPFNGSVRYSR